MAPILHSSSDRIVVVGAGPAGLVAALVFRLAGLNVRVIDKQPGPEFDSRAITIHSATFEYLRTLGLMDELMAAGTPNPLMDYHFLGEDSVPQLNFDQLKRWTEFPYVQIITQSDTEKILRDRLGELGCPVEWGTELTHLDTRFDPATVAATVVSRDDEVTVLHPQWLLGCDGVHSTVRRLMGIGFMGDEFPGPLRMTDGVVDGLERAGVAGNHIHYFMGRDCEGNGQLLFLSALPDGTERMIISDFAGGGRGGLTAGAFQAALDVHFAGRVRLTGCAQPHEFRIGQRIADTFRDLSGKVFLLGDSAHCHSIAGGLGLNAAMQDAINLAWKMVMVARDEARPSLLDTFEPERREMAKVVADTGNAVQAVIMAHKEPMTERLTIAERLNADGTVQRISGIAQSYRSTGLHLGVPHLEGLAVGDRAPDVRIRQNTNERLHNVLSQGYTVLGVQCRAHSDTDWAGLAARVSDRFGSGRVRFAVLTHPDFASATPNLAQVADTAEFHGLFGIPGADALYVLRPDRFIAACCPATDKDQILNRLEAVLL